jgi:drug/metabolite transporter (DMT)-like permease
VPFVNLRWRFADTRPGGYRSSMPHTDARPYVWMLCGSFSFTLMAVLVSDLVHYRGQCDWQTVAVFRAGLVAVFAAVVARLAGVPMVFWPWRLWVRSVAGSCSMVCTFYALHRLPVADVVTLTNTFPIWVALLSWPLYGRPPGAKMALAVLVGVTGVGLVEQPHFEAGNLGVVSALAAAVMTAVAMLGLHSLGDVEPLAVVVHFSAVATFVCCGAFLVTPVEHPLAELLDWVVMLKLLVMGFAALVGQLFLTLAFSRGAPAKVSVVGLTQIVFALAFGVWLFDHRVNALTLVGTVLVIAPTAWLLTRPRDVAPHPPAAAAGEPPSHDSSVVEAPDA